jgi:pSer/pThr/pTyr-binding forkhead associated (FHA) protein
MSLRLIIEDDEGSTTIVPLGRDAITIGRQQGNTIQLTEKNVSRRHAQLLPEGQTWVLEDLGSYNGVKVNGRATGGRVVLQEGDVVQIGDYHLALTEDVDRRTLNYDRGRSAANDSVEPMLASSSTNLPKLTPEGLAALSSGQHAAALAAPMPPSFVDSGQMPMVARAQVATDEPKGKMGMMVAGLLLIGGLALGGFWWASRPPESSQTATVTAETAANKAKALPPKLDPAPSKVDPTPPKIEPVSPKIEPVSPKIDPPPVDPTVDPDPDPTIDATPPDPTVDPTPPDPTTDPTPPKPTPPKPTPPKPTPPKPTPPKPDPEPSVDADALLAEAQKESFKNPAAAYELAAKSYAAKKSAKAASMMAGLACRMKDAAKARKAVGRLKGKQHDDAVQFCADNGINVE